MSLGENIRRIRLAKGMTQGELEKKTGIKTAQISRIERPGSDPKISTVLKIMEGLDCSANTLIMNENEAKSEIALQIVIEKAEKLPEKEKLMIIEITKAISNNHAMKCMEK